MEERACVEGGCAKWGGGVSSTPPLPVVSTILIPLFFPPSVVFLFPQPARPIIGGHESRPLSSRGRLLKCPLISFVRRSNVPLPDDR